MKSRPASCQIFNFNFWFQMQYYELFFPNFQQKLKTNLVWAARFSVNGSHSLLFFLSFVTSFELTELKSPPQTTIFLRFKKWSWIQRNALQFFLFQVAVEMSPFPRDWLKCAKTRLFVTNVVCHKKEAFRHLQPLFFFLFFFLSKALTLYLWGHSTSFCFIFFCL